MCLLNIFIMISHMLIDNQIKSYAVRDVFIVPHDEADRAVN